MWNILNVLVFLLLQFLFKPVLSEDCKLIRNGSILNCSNLLDFPKEQYYNIKTIRFSNSALSELKTDVFFKHNFFNLEEIILRYSHITHIHQNTFSNMKNVNELDLYGNNLTIFSRDSFNGLDSLKELDLGHNGLVFIDAEILKPLQSLKVLNLSDNRIQGLSPDFLESTNVIQLGLANNPIEFAKEGPIFISRVLKKLFLKSCSLKQLPSGAFAELPQLIHLDISDNSLNILPPGLLKPLLNLKYLDISYNPIIQLSDVMFPLPSKLEVLLCNENPLENISYCENLLDILKNNSKYTTETKFMRDISARTTGFDVNTTKSKV